MRAAVYVRCGLTTKSDTSPNQHQRKVIQSLSFDGLVSLLVVFLMAALNISVPVLVCLWLVLFAAIMRFLFYVQFWRGSNLIKTLVMTGVACGIFLMAYDSVAEKITADAVKEESEEARIDIVGVQFADIAKSDVSFPFFNFIYRNDGHLTARGVRRRFAFRSIDGRQLEQSEIEDIFTSLESDPYVFENGNDIVAGGNGYFSEPNKLGEEQQALDKALPDIRAGKSILYLFEVYKYRDDLLTNDEVRVAEFCVSFSKPLLVPHYWRQNEIHLEKTSKLGRWFGLLRGLF